jgi:orotate phosphoribosyltransferase
MNNREDPLVAIVRKYDAISKSNWALARGMPSKHFFDMDKLTYAPESIRVIASKYVEKIKEIRAKKPDVDRLAFIEKDFGTVGVLPLMSEIASQTGIDASVIRLRKEMSLVNQKGAKLTDRNTVVIVSDVLTSGESIEKTSQIIKSHGAKVPYAIVLYDREQGGKNRLQQSGIKVETALTRTQLVESGDVLPGPEAEFSPEEEVIAPPQAKIKEFEGALSSESRDILKSVHIK